jgi:hypothetical protein
MWLQPNPRDLPAHHEALVAQLRSEIHRGPVSERRAVRRWLGRQLVRVGTRLAAEPTMRPVRSP